MADAWQDALYGFGAAAGWWFAWRYDPTGSRWLTLVVAVTYSISAALRLVLALGGSHG